MKTWDDWNDSDIDFAVCEITGNIVTTIYESGKTDKIHTAHYCNSWADMGPIIFDNGICLTSPTVAGSQSNGPQAGMKTAADGQVAILLLVTIIHSAPLQLCF